MAVRMPAAGVNARRSLARKSARKKGEPPSHAHLTLRAWNRFLTKGPHTSWQTDPVVKVSPGRWPIELLWKAWKSALPLAAIKTKKEDTTLCSLSGRMLLLLLN